MVKPKQKPVLAWRRCLESCEEFAYSTIDCSKVAYCHYGIRAMQVEEGQECVHRKYDKQKVICDKKGEGYELENWDSAVILSEILKLRKEIKK